MYVTPCPSHIWNEDNYEWQQFHQIDICISQSVHESHSRNFPTEEAFYPCCIILWKRVRVVIKMSSKALDPYCIVSWKQVQDLSSKCPPMHFAHCATKFVGNLKLVNHMVKQQRTTSRKILSQQSLKMASLPIQLAFGRPSTWVGIHVWYIITFQLYLYVSLTFVEKHEYHL